jgi:hypothetical protein
MVSSMTKYPRVISAVLSCLLIWGTGTAQAGANRKGNTARAIEALTRGNAVAYDPLNKVYLVVSSYGVLRGRFVTTDGTPAGLPFTIQAVPDSNTHFAHFPRVAFSPDADGGAGGFLVTWHEGAPNTHARMVSFGRNGAYGNDTQLTTDTCWWEAGAPIAYATGSKEFLVAWRSMPVKGGAANNDIHAVRLDNTATPKAAVLAVTNDAQYQDNPSIAYNPVSDEFMLVFAGFNDPGNFAFVDSQRLKAGANALTGAAVRLTQTGGTYITDVTYNPASNTFLASWYSLPGSAAFGRIINADGTLNGNIITLSGRYKAYDALSIAYNKRSDTFLMVSHGTAADDGAVELTSAGTPIDNGFVVTGAGGKGNFYPRVTASSDAPNWLVSTANDFTSTMVQLVEGTASATAPADPAPSPSPAPSPPPVPGGPNPKMNVDYPGANTQVAGNAFLVAGWALDQGASTGTGVDAIDVWAFPVGVSTATLVGSATYGIARGDVAAFVGAQFTNCGFTLIGSIPTPGAYDLYVYAHSTVTATWNNVKIVRVTVTAPVSNPRMWVDVPSANATTSQNMTIAGWAIDLVATTGTGVNAVDIWAINSAGLATFVGSATYGTSRPDIAAFAGASRFAPSGFVLNAPLAAGDYTLQVFARSTVTNAFSVVQVPIKVR